MTQPYDPSRHLRQASITGVTITPVAFRDLPLLNTVGVHEPFALRAIVEISTDAGVSGFGETYGDAGHIARLELAAAALAGTDIFNINAMRSRIEAALQNDAPRVTVEAIDGLPIGGIRDFDPPGKTGYWITRCAGEYYGIKLDVILP